MPKPTSTHACNQTHATKHDQSGHPKLKTSTSTPKRAVQDTLGQQTRKTITARGDPCRSRLAPTAASGMCFPRTALRSIGPQPYAARRTAAAAAAGRCWLVWPSEDKQDETRERAVIAGSLGAASCPVSSEPNARNATQHVWPGCERVSRHRRPTLDQRGARAERAACSLVHSGLYTCADALLLLSMSSAPSACVLRRTAFRRKQRGKL